MDNLYSYFIKNLLKINTSILLSFIPIYLVVVFSYSSMIGNQLSKMDLPAKEKAEIVKTELLYNSKDSIMIVRENNIDYPLSNLLFIRLYSNIYMNDFRLFVKNGDYFYGLDYSDITYITIILLVMLSITISLITSYILYNQYINEKEAAIKSIAGKEALLANKSMIMLTENIHHELNTPMEVIENKLEGVREMIMDCLKVMTKDETYNERFKKLQVDFEYINQSAEQIYNILSRMKGFKQLRYSNGDRSIYDIVEGAFKVVSISTTKFDYKISDELKNYTLNSDSFKNADLLNILINHTKNSLEANSTKIYIVLCDISKGFMVFRMLDNGNGIKDEFVKSIFAPNFSTKTKGNSGVRGNGLYLNKSIIETGGGNLKLVETSKFGTTFELSVPVKVKS